MRNPPPSFLYRHFDEEGRLLYVGISLCSISRQAQHRALSPWFYEVRCIKIEAFKSRAEAAAAEAIAILEEKPLHNRALNTDVPALRPLNLSEIRKRKREALRELEQNPAYATATGNRRAGMKGGLMARARETPEERRANARRAARARWSNRND